MKFIKTIYSKANLTSYGTEKDLRNIGVDITATGLRNYVEKESVNMRLDVLCGLRKLVEQKTGKAFSWNEYGKLLDEEFLNRGKE